VMSVHSQALLSSLALIKIAGPFLCFHSRKPLTMFGVVPVINNAQYGNTHGREICKLQQSIWDITLKLIVLESNKRLHSGKS